MLSKLKHTDEWYEAVDYTVIKKCSKCGEEKPLGEFGKERDASTGFRAYCKACANAAPGRHTNKNKHLLTDEWYAAVDRSQKKTCPKCKRELTLNDFTKNLQALDGFTYHCKDCTRDNHEKSHLRRKNKFKDNTEYYEVAEQTLMKTCPRCKETKLANNFSRDYLYADGFMGYCRKCTHLMNKGKSGTIYFKLKRSAML